MQVLTSASYVDMLIGASTSYTRSMNRHRPHHCFHFESPDYDNAMVAGLPKSTIALLRVQNAAAILITAIDPCDHLTPARATSYAAQSKSNTNYVSCIQFTQDEASLISGV
jgi:hypothetical protein